MTEEAAQGQALVKAQPIPRDMAALGVKLAQDEVSGMQMVVIPEAVREKANVLMPVQAFQQADPHWTPSLRAVQLNPNAKEGPHFYEQAGRKLAPTKQALELLADAAGVVSTQVFLVRDSVERFEVGGVMASTFEHKAVLRIRKSDGTLRTIEASKTYEPDAEYEEIRDAARGKQIWENGQNTGRKLGDEGNEVAYEAEVRKRWLAEIKNAKAKNESKAVLRAIRSALQIPHTFKPADVQKPFLVIGWNFTPPDDEQTRAAIAAVVGDLYGGGRVAESHQLEPAPGGGITSGEELYGDRHDPREAEIPLEPAPEPTAEAEKPQEPGGDAEPAPGAQEAENGAERVQEPPADEPEHVEGEVEEDDEPEPLPEEESESAEDGVFSAPAGAGDDRAVALAEEAAKLVPPVGMFAPGARLGGEGGVALGAILEYGDESSPERGREWLQWALRNRKVREEEPVFFEALSAFVQVYAPDLVQS